MRALILALVLAACAAPIPIERTYAPVARQVSEVCVLHNPRTLIAGFQQTMVKSLENNGITARPVDQATLGACPVWLTYAARRRRDEVPYMALLDVNVFATDAGEIGRMRYYVRGIARDEARYDPPETVITPMLAELFPNR